MFFATSVNNMAHGDLGPLAVNGHWSQCISTLADFTQLFKSDEYRYLMNISGIPFICVCPDGSAREFLDVDLYADAS